VETPEYTSYAGWDFICGLGTVKIRIGALVTDAAESSGFSCADMLHPVGR